MDQLAERLARQAAIFDQIISMIPAKVYLTDQAGVTDERNPHYKHKKDLVDGDEIRNRRNAARKLKVDPDAQKNTVDLQKERYVEVTENEEVHDDIEDTKVIEARQTVLTGHPKTNPNKIPLSGPFAESEGLNKSTDSSIHELKARLQAKIAAMASKREAKQSKTPKSRNEVLDQRKKRKLARQNAIKAKKDQVVVSPPPRNETKRKSDEQGDDIKIGNKVLFGDHIPKKQRLDPKVALNKLKQKEDKLERTKSISSEKAEGFQMSEEWKKSLKKASGEKQQDNAARLKKAIKRAEKKKEKSSKEWTKRIKAEKMDLKKRQQKRQENLDKRKEMKKSKKKR